MRRENGDREVSSGISSSLILSRSTRLAITAAMALAWVVCMGSKRSGELE
ncbi:hypothetical protein J7E68_09125 [Microbacterium sp. ISL-103]|nr:hypothetical protein [Microbacterium sp. ISL-103]MBT2474730.1 hypothetical protein [Microbacterium sp. ISL-103]